MIVFRLAVVSLLIAGGICAGCANPVWVDSGNPHELDVIKLSERDLHPDGATPVVTTSSPVADRDQGTGDRGSEGERPGTFRSEARHACTRGRRGTCSASAPETNASRELLALIAEVQSLGAMDPAAQRQLMSDLKQSDPALWPQLVRQFRIAMAYRKHAAEATATPVAAGDEDSSSIGGTVPGATARKTAATDDAAAEPAAAKSNGGGDAKPANPSAAEGNPPATSVVVKPARPATKSAVKSAAAARKPAVKSADPADQAVSQVAVLLPEKAPPKSAVKAPVNPSAAPPADDWQLRLSTAILTLEGETADGATGPAEIERQVRLRFLYLLSGRRDDAMRPISGMAPAEQEFWSKELYGLASYLDAQRIADPQRRATEAALHLGEAVARLGELATPSVRNLAFCQKVDSFGVFKKFPDYDFKPGDEVLLYCEVENLKSESTDKGFHTCVKSSYQILDGRGSRVAEQEFTASDDYCTSPRRDFFIPYYIWIPKRISPGPYTLQLTVEDAQTRKVGQSSIQFNVK